MTFKSNGKLQFWWLLNNSKGLNTGITLHENPSPVGEVYAGHCNVSFIFIYNQFNVYLIGVKPVHSEKKKKNWDGN